MRPATPHLDVSIEELQALLERARKEPLPADGYQKLKAAIHTLGHIAELLENREATLGTLRRLLCQSSTERTEDVLKRAGIETGEKHHKPAAQRTSDTPAPGHGRNGASAFRAARRVQVPHGVLAAGDRCPDVSEVRCMGNAIPVC